MNERWNRNAIIDENIEYILSVFKQFDIDSPRVVYAGGEQIIYVTNNGRSYQIRVDDWGYIHIDSEGLAKNPKRRTCFIKKKKTYTTWPLVCNRLRTAHRVYDKEKQDINYYLKEKNSIDKKE